MSKYKIDNYIFLSVSTVAGLLKGLHSRFSLNGQWGEKGNVSLEVKGYQTPADAREFPSYAKGTEWIDCLESVFGATGQVITPEANPGTVCETAIYYFPPRVVENPDFFDNHTTLMIKRNQMGRNRDFRVNVIVIRNGERQEYDCPAVSKIELDFVQKVVRFVNNCEESQPDHRGVEVLSTGHVDWLN